MLLFCQSQTGCSGANVASCTKRAPSVTHTKLRNDHLPDDTSSAVIRAGLSGQSQYTALHTPHRLIRVFSSRSCASKVTKAAESAALRWLQLTGLLPPHALSKIRPFGRLFIALIESPDTFHEVVPRLEISPLIHMCDSTQKREKQHAHTAWRASLFVTESLNYLFRSPF